MPDEVTVTLTSQQKATIIASLAVAGMNGLFTIDEVWVIIDILSKPSPDDPIALYPVRGIDGE